MTSTSHDDDYEVLAGGFPEDRSFVNILDHPGGVAVAGVF